MMSKTQILQLVLPKKSIKRESKIDFCNVRVHFVFGFRTANMERKYPIARTKKKLVYSYYLKLHLVKAVHQGVLFYLSINIEILEVNLEKQKDSSSFFGHV